MPVSILGMHRSGTSMITRLIHLCGLYLGPEKDLMQPQASDNPEGYWENINIQMLNDRILEVLGATWDTPPVLTAGWTEQANLRVLQNRVHGVVNNWEQAGLWGWKDPRTMLVLEFWQKLFPDTKYILCMRSPLEVAYSLSKRGLSGAPFDQTLQLWEIYHEAVLSVLQPEQYLVTHYETFFYDPAAELRRILRFIGLPEDEGCIHEAIATISPNLHRNTFPHELMEVDTRLPASVYQHYQGFCQRAGEVFARMRKDSAYNYQRVAKLTRQQHEQINQLQNKFQQHESGLGNQLQTLQAEIAQLQQALKVSTQIIETKDHALERMTMLLQQAHTEKGTVANIPLPVHSPPTRAYYLLRTSTRILVNEGPGRFIDQSVRWLRGERRYYKRDTRTSDSAPAPPQLDLTHIIESRKQPKNTEIFSVLFVVTHTEFVSKRYRAYNVAEQLQGKGLRAEVITSQEVDTYLCDALTYDIIVFNRIPLSPPLERLIDQARKQQIVLVFEADDFVFDDRVFPYLDGVRNLDDAGVAGLIASFKLYRRILDACDFYLGTTQFLADRAEEVGRPGFVIRNGLNARQIELSQIVLQAKQAFGNDAVIKIGYLPGTATHNQDFAVVSDALVRIMREYEQVVLCIRGYLDTLPRALEPFRSRIQLLPFVPWEELVAATAELDINIAPLEHANPFTEAKSALKYFEGGLVKVPTVASPVEDFKIAIRHGENGFLASNEQEWYESLKALIVDPQLRHTIAENAYRDVMQRYTPQAQSESSIAVFREMLDRKAPIVEGLNIGWITFKPSPGSGGYRNILNAATDLHAMGHINRIYVVDDGSFRSNQEFQQFIQHNFMDTPIDFVLGIDHIRPCDALVATQWETASIVRRHQHLCYAGFYFVQDFEPFFLDTPEGYQLAEDTYRLGLTHITLGRWLTKMLTERYNAEADYFLMPIDHTVYFPRDVKKEKRRIVFLARPEMPRRRYELGLSALQIFHRKHPDVEIVLFGSSQIDSAKIPFAHTNLRVVIELDELAQLYSGADVGIVFSTTNPSLMPWK